MEKNPREAIKYFKLAAAQNNTDALFNLGAMYEKGEGIEPDIEEALRYFKLAEDNGDQEAKQIRIKLLFKCKDLESLKGYADEGDPDAQYKYAIKLYEQAGNAQSQHEAHEILVSARQFLETSVAKGHKFAPFTLAYMQYFGLGGTQDLPSARKNYKILADHGDSTAQHNYASMMIKGEGGDKDTKQGQVYLEMAANKGFIEAVIVLEWLRKQNFEQDKKIQQPEIIEEDLKIDFPPISEANVNDLETVSESLINFVPEKAIEGTPAPMMLPVQPFEIIKEEAETKGIIVDKEAEQDEISRLLEKQKQDIIDFRTKKLAQKAIAAQAKQTLTMKRKDYEETKLPSVKKAQITTKKSNVAHETLEFVKTIFGVGTLKINAFSIHAARKAFADLGCEVSTKKGENSTKLKFILDGKWVVKFKFHNPHGQGENLYDDLKPYMKRYLESINKTPDKLIT